LWATISSGNTWRGEIVNKRKDGTLFIENATISPVSDEAGFILNYVAVKRDVTAFREAEEKLRTSEEKYYSLFNQSMEGIYLHDLDGRILDVNQTACEQSGYSREECLSRTIFDLHRGNSETNLSKAEILQAWSR
jgi:PAS domain-containing protein